MPAHLRDKSGQANKRMGHGKGYAYSHDFPEGISGQDYLEKPLALYAPEDRRRRGRDRRAARALARPQGRPCPGAPQTSLRRKGHGVGCPHETHRPPRVRGPYVLARVRLAADEDKEDEMGTIAGLEIARSQGDGWLGLELKDSTFKLKFYNDKKKPIPADATSVAMRWSVHYQPNDERTLLVPTGDPAVLASPYFVRPPHSFPLHLILLFDGKPDASEAYSPRLQRLTGRAGFARTRVDRGGRRGDFVRMSPSQTSPFDSVESAVADIAAGRMVIVTDDERRENEGDLIMAASLATAEAVGLMIRHGSGIVCVATTGEVLLRLGLGPDGRQQQRRPPDGFRHQRRFAPRVSRRGSARRTARSRSGPSVTRRRSRSALRVPGTFFPCGPGRAGSLSAPGTPRRPSTSPCSPGSTRAASCASS